MQYTAILAALALASATNAHMEMSFPPPLRSKFNSHAKNADYSMTAPLTGAAQFPCKGYQSDMADTSGAGASVVDWAPGAKVNFTIVGGATHGGGSCQAALSYDQGKSFTVIHSYIGNVSTNPNSNPKKYQRLIRFSSAQHHLVKTLTSPFHQTQRLDLPCSHGLGSIKSAIARST